MNKSRVDSYPDLVLPFSKQDGPKALEGVAANVKLLLKLVQDHQDAAHGGDGRQSQRIATMLTILDDVRSRVETSKASSRKAELRRCNTELRRSAPVVPLLPDASSAVKEKKPPLNPATEEIHRLRRELADSIAARKSMGRMFSGMGKEKETIARELAMKVHELACTEEIVGYLKKQNETLSEKVRACCNEHGADLRADASAAAGGGGDGGGDHVLLQERNKALTEQLLKSLDGHRMMKRRLREEREERERVQTKMAEMAAEAAAGEERARRLRETLSGGGGDDANVQEELCLLDKAFARFYRRLSPRGSPMRSE